MDGYVPAENNGSISRRLNWSQINKDTDKKFVLVNGIIPKPEAK